MSLSMDEQRMLAEIERRLSAEDPKLAAKLSAFRRPGPAGRLRSPRGRIIGSLFTVALVAVISMMVYAMVPFRAHVLKPTASPQASSSSSVSARTGPATTGTPNASAQSRQSTAAAGATNTASTTSAQWSMGARTASHHGTTAAKTTASTKTPESAATAR